MIWKGIYLGIAISLFVLMLTQAERRYIPHMILGALLWPILALAFGALALYDRIHGDDPDILYEEDPDRPPVRCATPSLMIARRLEREEKEREERERKQRLPGVTPVRNLKPRYLTQADLEGRPQGYVVGARMARGPRPQHPPEGDTMQRRLDHRFADALRFAEDLHREQTRKGSDLPYISHLMSVCALVLEHGGDEDQAIAALLHDAAEDQGGRPTLDRIRERYGSGVADIVHCCSDSLAEESEEKEAWLPRKRAYIAGFADKPERALLVIAADKLHNLQATVRDYRRQGPALWQAFRKKDKDLELEPTPAWREAKHQLWYYDNIAGVLRTRADASGQEPFQALIAELEREIGSLRELVIEREGAAAAETARLDAL